MRGATTEFKVGLFALVVLAILSYMTFKVSGTEWLRREGYTVYVYFSNVAGLDEKTKVKVAGVDSGIIEEISLEGGKAKLKVRIFPEVTLYRDALATIKATGLLGDKYLDIRPGAEEPSLADGDVIRKVLEPVDIDEMIHRLVVISDSFEALAQNINDVFGPEETKKALRETARNLAEITENLDRMISSSDRRLKETLAGINRLTASVTRLIDDNSRGITATVENFTEVSETLKTDLPVMVRELRATTNELRVLLEESRPRLTNLVERADKAAASVQRVAEKIEKGEGTLGRLVTDERLYESVNRAVKGVERTVSRMERFRTFITFQGEYLMEPKDGKGYFYLTLKPKPEKYYILGLVSDPLGRVTTKETVTTRDGVTTVEREEEIEQKVEFTAQIARRFEDTALRIGLTENTFGLGVDQYFAGDRLKVSADIWDFGNDEEGAEKPHLKVGLDYYLFRHLFINAGVDNLLNPEWRGFFIGSGLTFEDEDFKYIFGTVPKIPTR